MTKGDGDTETADVPQRQVVQTANNRRRRLLINPTLQSRIIVNISWPSAIALAMTALLLGIFSTRLLDEALVAKVELPSLIPILVTVIGFLILSLLYLVFNALKFSHRIAGPVYRLQKTLASAKGGDYSARANLRSHDFLVEVADSLNDFLSHVEAQQSTANAAATEWEAGVDGATGGIDFDDGGGPRGCRVGPAPAETAGAPAEQRPGPRRTRRQNPDPFQD